MRLGSAIPLLAAVLTTGGANSPAQSDEVAFDSIVTQGIRAGVYPAAVLVIGRRDRLLIEKGYGHLTWSARSPVPSPDSTLFDLASLTKVVATTSAAMVLVDRGRLRLDAPVQSLLPEFSGPGKQAVRVRDLLTHQSGLRASLRLDSMTHDATAAKRRVLAESLRWVPRTRTEYSDLNAMLLGWIVETVTAEPLDQFVHDSVFQPLGLASTMFRPSRSLRTRIAPVSLWHGTPIAGEVHDQNAARLGGVSGHAGLYSTGADLAAYAQWFLRHGRTKSNAQLVSSSIMDTFTARAAGDRALGWEMRDPKKTDNSGSKMSRATFGHTGFTGTSMWIDPDHDVFVIFLTNRVYSPHTRTSLSQLKQIRGKLADAAVDAVCRANLNGC